MKRNNLKKGSLLDWVIRLFLLIALACGIAAGWYYWSLHRDSSAFVQLSRTEAEEQRAASADNRPQEWLEKLQQTNEDLVGWLCIPDTQMNYPVMHTPDEPEYYLRKNFQKKYSLSGTPFLDWKCSVKPRTTNLMVYGHNMKDGSMFAELFKYKEQKYWKQHPQIRWDTAEETQYYEIAAAFPTEVYADLNIYGFMDTSDPAVFQQYVQKIKEVSLYDTGIDLELGDSLIMLSTCSYHASDGRFIVVGRYRPQAE